jgi:hypothetical protein
MRFSEDFLVTALEAEMPVRERPTRETFTLSPTVRFDDAKRHLRQLVTQLSEKGGEITICKTEDRPQFIVYDYEQAEARGDDLHNAHRVSVAQFVAKATSWQTILRYEGAPVVLEVNSVPKAVIKVHPQWRSETIKNARKDFLEGQRDQTSGKLIAQKVDEMSIKLDKLSAQVEEVLGLLKKHFT